MESGKLYQCKIGSPLGMITMISDGEALKELWLDRQNGKSERGSNQYIMKDDLEIFVQTKEWLLRYFAGDDPGGLEKKIALLKLEKSGIG